MRLGACKTRHLDVSQIIVFGVISDPTLDVLACVGAVVEEPRHRLYNLILIAQDNVCLLRVSAR
jgi:hypothetical protein